MRHWVLVILSFCLTVYCYALSGARYLIITPDAYVAALQPLAEWKTEKGMPVKIAPLSVTGSNATQIRNYILNAYNTWNPRPEYVLLVGSGFRLPAVGNSDDYYADLVTGNNPLIELSIGRFPCMFVSQCSTMVAKTLGYEKTPYLGDTTWYRKGTTIVDEDGQADSVYWQNARYVHIQWINNNYLQIDSFSFYQGHSASNVINAINNGRAYLMYRGSAVAYWWHFPFDPAYLSNNRKLPIVVSGTCATMYLSDTGYLGDKFLSAGSSTNPKGAVGFFGTTIATSGPGLARLRGTVATGFFQAIFQENIYKLGDAARRAKFLIDSIRPPYYVDTRYKEWNLYADPELSLYTRVPKSMTVTHDTIIQTGHNNYSVLVRESGQPLANALVCAMLDSSVYHYGYTDNNGVYAVNCYIPYPGFMKLTVTARNHLPYQKQVQVVPGGDVHDIGIISILEPIGSIANNSQVVPKVLVKNWGGYTDTCSITFRIGSVYDYTIPSYILNAGDTATIIFPSWTAAIGSYPVLAFTTLAPDQWRANDSVHIQISVIAPNDVGVEQIVNPDTIHTLNRITLVRAKIRNYGALAQTNFSVACSIVGANGILRYTNTQNIGLLNGQAIVSLNFSCWTPLVSETCMVIIRTGLTNDDNPLNDRISRVTLITENYFENFEEFDGAYLRAPANTGWKWGVPGAGPNSAHSGTRCWATGLTENYPNNANWKLTSPEFTATMNNPILKFWHWYETDDFLDGGNVKISLDSGESWILVRPQNGYPGWVSYENSAIPNESCYIGYSNWSEAVFTLPVAAGQHFLVRWHFGSSAYTSGAGWYLDDIFGIGMSGVTPLVFDVGVDSIMSPLPVIPYSIYLQPSAWIKNYGILRQENFSAVCSVFGLNHVIRYADIKTISLSPSQDTLITFSIWLPNVTEMCTVKIQTGLASDENAANDRKIRYCEIRWLLGSEGFDATAFPPAGWFVYNNDSGNQVWLRGTSFPHSGSACAEIRFESSTLRNDDWLVSPAITIPSASAEIRFWYRAHVTANYESLEVRLSNMGNTIPDFTILLDQFRFNNNIFAERVIPIHGYAGQNIYLAFINKGLNQRKIYLDDLMIKGFSASIAENYQANKSLSALLYTLHPNPSRLGMTQVCFSLGSPANTELKIYNSSGQLIKILIDTRLDTGVYNYYWDGKDELNRAAAEGVYFYTLKTDDCSQTKKLVLTR